MDTNFYLYPGVDSPIVASTPWSKMIRDSQIMNLLKFLVLPVLPLDWGEHPLEHQPLKCVTPKLSPLAMLGKMAKAMLKYLKKESSFIRIATRLFEWLIRKKRARSEEEFSTYDVGMQVSHCGYRRGDVKLFTGNCERK